MIPGHDPFHATSAARYLEECLPNVDYKDYTVPEADTRKSPGLDIGVHGGALALRDTSLAGLTRSAASSTQCASYGRSG